MNPREELIDLLIGGAEGAAQGAERVRHESGWPAIFDLAAIWSVIPNLRRRILDLGTPLAPDLKNRLFQLFKEVHVSSTLQARRGVAVCRKLEQEGFPAVIFKGLAATAHLYGGNPSARTIKDVDILVREQDLDGVLGVMRKSGLKPDHADDLTGYAAFVRNSPGFAGNQAVSLSGRGLGEMDVHWSLGPSPAREFRVEAIMERSVWVTLFGEQVRVAAPADGLLLSAHHAIREDFAADGMLRDVLDASAWLKLLEESGELQECLDRARRCRIGDAVLALWEILAARRGIVRGAARVSPDAAALARLFWLQARNGPLGKDLTYLADPHSIRQIFRGAVSGWAGYSAQMKVLETKLAGQPLSLRQRLIHLAQRLPRGVQGWKMIRALARTKAAYQRGGRSSQSPLA